MHMISALLEVYDNIMSALSNPNVICIDMVHLDFAKAFDKVDHHILLYKLKQFEITKQVGIWLASFLSNRKQFVQIPGGISTYMIPIEDLYLRAVTTLKSLRSVQIPILEPKNYPRSSKN